MANGSWHCWVCDAKGRSIYTLLKQLGIPTGILEPYKAEKSSRDVHTSPQGLSKEFISLPKEYISFKDDSSSFSAQLALKYLKSRNVTYNDIIRYNLGYCSTGEYQDMVIIPNYDEMNRLDYFVGRSYNSNAFIKFNSPSVEKSTVIGFENLIEWSFPIVLCEGPFDAIVIRRNAIPCYGKVVNDKVKWKIVEAQPDIVYMAFDPDAYKNTLKESEFFMNNGLDVRIVDLKGSDPADLGFEEFWKIADKATHLEKANHFEDKLRFLLS